MALTLAGSLPVTLALAATMTYLPALGVSLGPDKGSPHQPGVAPPRDAEPDPVAALFGSIDGGTDFDAVDGLPGSSRQARDAFARLVGGQSEPQGLRIDQHDAAPGSGKSFPSNPDLSNDGSSNFGPGGLSGRGGFDSGSGTIDPLSPVGASLNASSLDLLPSLFALSLLPGVGIGQQPLDLATNPGGGTQSGGPQQGGSKSTLPGQSTGLGIDPPSQPSVPIAEPSPAGLLVPAGLMLIWLRRRSQGRR